MIKRSMMRNLAILAALSFGVAACGGGHSGSVMPTSAQPNTGNYSYNGPSSLTFAWAKSVMTQAQYLGPVTQGVVITMNVAVRMQNEQGLLAYAQAASTPGNAVYRHFLSPQEIGTRFGANTSDYTTAAEYFAKYNLSVGGWPQHLALAVTGSTSNFSKAFGTPFGWYKLGNQTFVAPVSAPHLTTPEPIVAVSGLAQFVSKHTYIIRASSGQQAGMSPQQIGKGLDFSGAYGAGINGSGITVGIIGTGPINQNARTGDAAVLAAAYHTAIAPISVMPVVAQTASPQNGNTGTGAVDFNPAGLATPPPVTAPCNQPSPPAGFSFPIANYATCNPEDGEAQLDTESVASLAPGSIVAFYLAYNDGICVNTAGSFAMPTGGSTCPSGDVLYPEEGIQLTDDEIQQAIADNKADAISMSFGEGETNAESGGYISSTGGGLGPAEMAALAAEGIAVFASSGDTGNEACSNASTGLPLTTPCVSYPASDPSVVGVGGTNIPLDNTGKVVGQITAWADQTTGGGNGSFQNNIGSGGGLSQFISQPSYQTGLTAPTGSNPASSAINGFRAIPDLALDADPATGPAIAINAHWPGGGIAPIGGTSASAPEAAAAWALVLQACKVSSTCNAGGATGYRLGNPNPLIYAIYNGRKSLGYSQVFYDVQYGENQANGAGATPGPPITGCCTAGTGYDMVTGVGVPFVGHLIDAVVQPTTPVP